MLHCEEVDEVLGLLSTTASPAIAQNVNAACAAFQSGERDLMLVFFDWLVDGCRTEDFVEQEAFMESLGKTLEP
ncbi:hypothetical protein CP97_08480 [Aurantiacibacter atlanticus]|uniref:Uncharacterized protein n=1 Tax=Aurantiacibacter atlanticus TaxID=1648404 RepID=A0A0H4VG16_9SPHN|nr:hypothetical protein [Aurantiacibacter atlanticus]AKQ42049.1 hypothetical protein CP97_08480 [Aurantiacibacter atlanticus]MDF1834641.1 hypothetical protein [Alteraurantiacibacter sp. bin_em_oilr2.035]